jgi:NAD+ dependent glucose-6-phosphate dehydrogenase
MRVLITGAAGQIGSQIIDELSHAHELCLIDIRPVNGRKSIIGDLSVTTRTWRNRLKRTARWSNAFKGAQVVVHLAANPDPNASWESVVSNNIQATWNVIQAAAEHGVHRVVFASSNWAVKALEQTLAPDCYRPDGPKIDSNTPPFPLTAYGLSKGFGELAGKMFVDEGKLESFVAVRIGNHNPIPSTDEIVRARWLGIDDTRSLFRRCVEADIKGFHIVYGVSAQPTAPYNLAYTQELLSWVPRQLPDDRDLKRGPA